MEEGDDKRGNTDSPTNSQQTVSDDDEIDYTTKPEFYDPDLDDKDEKWIHKKRQGRDTDAVLSCPACFTTLCLECQRHEKYLTQYRAIFVVNCKIENNQVFRQNIPISRSRKRNRGTEGFDGSDAPSTNIETFKQVCCSVCSTEVGVIDEDEVYHFFNVLPSEP
ncbi:E2F-associated phosphoprotein [Sesbania bispinosa]|nr:E2F-associated phosphoprotein [Sesbania bispinosa]